MTRWAAPPRRLMLLLLLLCVATAEKLIVHRRRTCAFATLWDEGFKDAAQWTLGGGAQVDGGVLALGSGGDANARAARRVGGGWGRGVNRLQVTAKLPARGAASVSVRILPLDVCVALALDPQRRNALRLSSSQNASVVAEIPCVEDVRADVHALAFSWGAGWLRWSIDETVLYEEPIRSPPSAAAADDEASVLVEFAAASAPEDDGDAAAFQIQRVHLTQSDAEDPACAPRHPSSANCRKKAAYEPRLGSNQGYLSTEEIGVFINETANRLPSGFTRVEKIGTSVQGRPILALCLGACDSTAAGVPQALYTGMHHSRENLVYTIDLLAADVENGDLEALHLLFSRQLWFVLVVNPDGYARNEAQRIWERDDTVGQRKNTQPGCAKQIDNGVDLNRNYDVCFAHDSVGSSTDICAEDYRGPSPFSEPETQAIRDFVERPGMNFSTGLNYHSYGRYFNIPFACEANGLPDEAQLSIFQDLAAEMTRYNHFKYGQPWKESNLYTVNGETSDWMWQKHGVYAMSPEVGPDFRTPDGKGFWPPRDQVPTLSAELHYSNLHAALVAGAQYELKVAKVEVTGSHVSVHVSVANVGLRRAVGSVELIGSMYPNGSHASARVEIASSELGTLEAKREAAKTVEIPSRRSHSSESTRRIQMPVYIVLRDAFGCHLYRIAINDEPVSTSAKKTVAFQVWGDFRLPRCGICAAFARSSQADSELHSQATHEDPKCAGFEDVTTPHAIRLKHVSMEAGDSLADESAFHTATPRETTQPATAAPTPSTAAPASKGSFDAKSPAAVEEIQDENAHTSTPSSSPPPSSSSPLSSLSTSLTPVPASDTSTTPSSSSKTRPLSPRPTTKTLSLNEDTDSASATSSTSSSVWWRPTSFYMVLPAMALVVLTLILVVFVVIRRRRSRHVADTDASTAGSSKRRKQRYSRVVNDEVTLSPHAPDGSERGEFGARDSDSNDDSDDDLELVVRGGSNNRRSLGLRAGSPLRPNRSPGSPRRPVSPSSAKQLKQSSTTHPDVVV